MDDPRRFTPPAVGGSSLLVIFAVLCLTVFALLGLGTVQADQRLADASAEAVYGYYAADCQAEAILARLRAGELPEGVTALPGERYTYTCPSSAAQVREVEVRVTGTDYAVLLWQAVPAADWQPDDGLEVWDGESTARESGHKEE